MAVFVCPLLTWVLQSHPSFLNSQAHALSSRSETITFPLLEGGGTWGSASKDAAGVSLGPGILVDACVGLMGLWLGDGSHVTCFLSWGDTPSLI